eukprot:5891862-Alexandrium_andersonii.AAC.1
MTAHQRFKSIPRGAADDAAGSAVAKAPVPGRGGSSGGRIYDTHSLHGVVQDNREGVCLQPRVVCNDATAARAVDGFPVLLVTRGTLGRAFYAAARRCLGTPNIKASLATGWGTSA